MRGIWQQAARPRSSFASARTSLRSSFGRRAPRQHGDCSRIAACDVFAYFLGPLLAAAAFADTSWKDSKRKEWQRRFEEINDEVERLRAREVEVWARIQQRSVRRGAMLQRRMYSTTAAAVGLDPAESADWEEAFRRQDETQASRITDFSEAVATERPPSVGSPTTRYERLITQRLILRLLLSIYLENEPSYADRYKMLIRGKVLPEELGTAVRRIRDLSQEIFDLRESDRRYENDWSKSSTRYAERKMLASLAQDYQNQKLGTADMIDQVVKWLMEFEHRPAGSEAYIELVLFFTACRLSGPADIALQALQSSGCPISPMGISAILELSSQLRDMKAYSWVLTKLTGADSWPRRGLQRWEWVRVRQTVLPVPTYFHKFIYRALIRASLTFGQYDRAEGYYHLTQRYTWGPNHETYVLKAFLQYCAINLDWQEGQRWIRQTLDHLSDENIASVHIADRLVPELSKLSLRIADLFVACEKPDMIEIWLTLLADTGLPPPSLTEEHKRRSDGLKWIVQQWAVKISAQSSSNTQFDLQRFQDRVTHFGASFKLGEQVPSQTSAEAANLPSALAKRSAMCGAAWLMENEPSAADTMKKRQSKTLPGTHPKASRAETSTSDSPVPGDVADLLASLVSEREHLSQLRSEQEKHLENARNSLRELHDQAQALREEISDSRRRLEVQTTTTNVDQDRYTEMRPAGASEELEAFRRSRSIDPRRVAGEYRRSPLLSRRQPFAGFDQGGLVRQYHSARDACSIPASRVAANVLFGDTEVDTIKNDNDYLFGDAAVEARDTNEYLFDDMTPNSMFGKKGKRQRNRLVLQDNAVDAKWNKTDNHIAKRAADARDSSKVDKTHSERNSTKDVLSILTDDAEDEVDDEGENDANESAIQSGLSANENDEDSGYESLEDNSLWSPSIKPTEAPTNKDSYALKTVADSESNKIDASGNSVSVPGHRPGPKPRHPPKLGRSASRRAGYLRVSSDSRQQDQPQNNDPYLLSAAIPRILHSESFYPNDPAQLIEKRLPAVIPRVLHSTVYPHDPEQLAVKYLPAVIPRTLNSPTVHPPDPTQLITKRLPAAIPRIVHPLTFPRDGPILLNTKRLHAAIPRKLNKTGPPPYDPTQVYNKRLRVGSSKQPRHRPRPRNRPSYSIHPVTKERLDLPYDPTQQAAIRDLDDEASESAISGYRLWPLRKARLEAAKRLGEEKGDGTNHWVSVYGDGIEVEGGLEALDWGKGKMRDVQAREKKEQAQLEKEKERAEHSKRAEEVKAMGSIVQLGGGSGEGPWTV